MMIAGAFVKFDYDDVPPTLIKRVETFSEASHVVTEVTVLDGEGEITLTFMKIAQPLGFVPDEGEQQ